MLQELFTPFILLPLPVKLVVVFVFSLLVGSFINVVIYRLPIIMENQWKIEAREVLELKAIEEEIFTLNLPRSRCRNCGRMIRSWENIPILSYLCMRGKCINCKERISIFYPLVELLTALLATFVFLSLGAQLQGLFAIFFVFSLIALTGIDFKTQLLPDIITLPLMWAGILLSFFEVNNITLQISVLGAVIAYLSLWTVAFVFRIIFKKEGMGMGDAKLLAAIFAWVHIEYLPIVLIIACISGLFVTVIQRIFNKEKLSNNPLPFGPYLALGGLLALLYGQTMVQSYNQFLFV